MLKCRTANDSPSVSIRLATSESRGRGTSTIDTQHSTIITPGCFFGGGLTIPLEGGLDDVDESLLALASSSSNSATRRVSRSICARSSSISASQLSIGGQYQNRQISALSIHSCEEHRRLSFRNPCLGGEGGKKHDGPDGNPQNRAAYPQATTFGSVPGARETRERLRRRVATPNSPSPNRTAPAGSGTAWTAGRWPSS